MTAPHVARPITVADFAPFGEVIETDGHPHVLINDGACQRFTDLASFDIVHGDLGLSLFQSQVRDTPYRCDLLERHPKGSQCFVPMQGSAYFVIVAPDDGGKPGTPALFTAASHQIVNIARNTWHGVLAPYAGSGLFAVLDRIGQGPNLEEHRLEEPIWVTPQQG